LWSAISEITGYPKITDFISLVKFWILGKKYIALNVCSSAVIWTLWKTRNNTCF
jgi:hypothetical protein